MVSKHCPSAFAILGRGRALIQCETSARSPRLHEEGSGAQSRVHEGDERHREIVYKLTFRLKSKMDKQSTN